MSYHVVYGTEDSSVSGRMPGRRIVLTGFFLICFFWMVSAFWPEGKELLKIMLIPGDPDATLEAAEVFAGEMACGIPLHHAAENFCLTVLHHGYPG